MSDPIFREPGRKPAHDEAQAVPQQRRFQGKRRPAEFDTPEAREHAREADDLKAVLAKEFGVEPEIVAPTRNMQGHVRMNFDQVWDLVEAAEKGSRA